MLARPRIALVEDSTADQYLFRKMIQRALPDAQVQVFPSAGEFRQALQPDSFDCIVLDNRLPDGTGLDVLQELRGIEIYSTLPAIVLTGSGDESTAVKAMKWGASDYLPKADVNETTLVSALDGAFTASQRENAKRENNARLQQQALTDGLTGVFNRRAFDEAVEKLDAPGQRVALALVYLDLDGFKEVNDIRGHAAGDEVLRVISARLRAIVRGSDVVYRLGGDEFAIVLLPPPRGEDLKDLVQRVVVGLNEAVCDRAGSEIFAGGGSVGVAWREKDGEAIAALVSKADAAMYAAKKAGGGAEFVSA